MDAIPLQTNPTRILDALVRFYREALSLPEESIFLAIEPLNPPTIPPGGDWWMTISPADGSFEIEEQGAPQLRHVLRCQITAYTRLALDRTDRETLLLTDAQRGVFRLLAELLRITGQTLRDRAGTPLTAPVIVRQSTKPTYDTERGIGWVGILVELQFDWNLAELHEHIA